MNKILLIIQREYLTRVRKKSFIVMTILGPLLIAAMFVVPIWLMTIEDEDVKTIAVVDNQENKFASILNDSKSIKFEYIDDKSVDILKKEFSNLSYYAVLYNTDEKNYSIDSITLSSTKQPSINVKEYIAGAIEKHVEEEKLAAKGINHEILDQIKTNVNIKTLKWTQDGKEEESSTEVIMFIGFVAAIIIYMFIFIYGAQVMRGVIEEKTNRIVEIIISSVKPFQLMMGKIVGVALVAITQFILWIVLSIGIITLVQTTFMADYLKDNKQVTENMIQNESMGQIKNMPLDDESFIATAYATMNNLPWFSLLSSFLFFFLGGYLLYTSLFAAIGSAVDNEADTQQFMLPVTIPLILAFLLAQPVIQNPEGPLAFWFSIIPFTSPIIMMVRIPFGVPAWEMIISMALLIIMFVATTWLAAKIYRTGILMYGKKINYKELWKWLRYSNY